MTRLDVSCSRKREELRNSLPVKIFPRLLDVTSVSTSLYNDEAIRFVIEHVKR
jgi:hypothetical protein